MTPEFSRPERIDTIGAGERGVTITAEPAERAALAARFGLLAVDRLEASLSVRREAGGIAVRGRVAADVVQACTVTDEPIPVTIDETVALLFVEERDGGEDDEIELDVGALDTIPYEGGAIDLGEAAAETMALALDPFPRSANAAAVLREAGVLSEDEVKPLNALAALGDLLKNKPS
ncbi:DUF177 domain-containing protein [Sphingomonas sp. NFR15]|uniref:YceD family protein n=1 Tax=Sphingomonas sp. NFR15 TaxID=1566282 RepID=UPI0008844413|nr:DUF177 domain-containing protein [Sphingomonas sp. NFR15]SDA33377.1 Uncharacterized metal-binding protein YceD, DUF177 family [Sphingomonas sp. NFR15]